MGSLRRLLLICLWTPPCPLHDPPVHQYWVAASVGPRQLDASRRQRLVCFHWNLGHGPHHEIPRVPWDARMETRNTNGLLHHLQLVLLYWVRRYRDQIVEGSSIYDRLKFWDHLRIPLVDQHADRDYYNFVHDFYPHEHTRYGILNNLEQLQYLIISVKILPHMG